jgi:hypothetical protein
MVSSSSAGWFVALTCGTILIMNSACGTLHVEGRATYYRTETEAGQTIHLNSGDEIRLSFDARSGRDWDVTSSNDAIAQLTLSGIESSFPSGDRRRLITFRMRQPGMATLIACPKSKESCTLSSPGAIQFYVVVSRA